MRALLVIASRRPSLSLMGLEDRHVEWALPFSVLVTENIKKQGVCIPLGTAPAG